MENISLPNSGLDSENVDPISVSVINDSPEKGDVAENIILSAKEKLLADPANRGYPNCEMTVKKIDPANREIEGIARFFSPEKSEQRVTPFDFSEKKAIEDANRVYQSHIRGVVRHYNKKLRLTTF